MKFFAARLTGVAFLLAAGVAYSNKGGAPTQVKISRAVASNGTFVTLEWRSEPQARYTVESSIDMEKWETIAENLIDPNAPADFIYQIPNQYVFDSRRFFRIASIGE